MKINVGIIGAGTMGGGIAQVAASSGCNVKMFDLNGEALIKAEAKLNKLLNRLIDKGRIDEKEKERIQCNIQYVDSLKNLSNSELIIEAIVEDLDIKQNVFIELESFFNGEIITSLMDRHTKVLPHNQDRGY